MHNNRCFQNKYEEFIIYSGYNELHIHVCF